MYLNRESVFLLHILLVGPLLAYVGHNGAKTDKQLFDLLKVVGIGVILYHSYMYAKIQGWL